MASILDMAREVLSPDLINRINGIIGESPAATQKAVGAAAPTILVGLADRAASPGGVESMRSMVTEGGYGGGMLDSLGSLLGGGGTADVMQSGTRLLSSLFGGRIDGIIDALASFAGMRRGSASSLMALVTPIVMSVIGKQIGTRGLDGLVSMLTGQRDAIASALPSSLAGLVTGRDTTGASVTPTEYTPTAHELDRFAEEKRVSRGWSRAWPWALAGLAALALIFLLTRSYAPEVARAPLTDTQTPAASIRETASIALPDGRQVNLTRGGFLDQLNTILAGKTSGELPLRLVFDNLNFESGSSKLTPQSQATVDSLALILEAYPAAQIALEGHTDSTGDAATNKQLSLDRAESIKAGLVHAGVGPGRISVVGHGQERPVASNDTDEGRARNRRTELVVLKR